MESKLKNKGMIYDQKKKEEDAGQRLYDESVED